MVMVQPKVEGQEILEGYTDEMIAYMVTTLNVPQFEAELAVTQLWPRWIRAYGEAYIFTPTPISKAADAFTAALKYLRDDVPGTSPGPLADSAWHVMMHHDTRCLFALYEAMLGGYRHHVPNDVVGIEKSGKCDTGGGSKCSSKCVCS